MDIGRYDEMFAERLELLLRLRDGDPRAGRAGTVHRSCRRP
ncbi:MULTISPECIES: hypothetical protein [Streptomyces]|uniref:ArsR family transcriptional regulator n=2 Tax=Streptomyces TaxID=1883 RepID=A0ABV9J1V1_9ACTN